jgi:ribosomal protein S26
MGDVVKMFHGRVKRGKALPKPVECDACGEDIETARLQVMPKAKRCISCERARELRHNRMMQGARERDLVIIRG